MKKSTKPPYTCYVEQRAMTKYGWRWISWTVKSIFDKNNNITGAVASGRDTTDRKKVEEALKEIEEFNKSILENSPSPNLVINLDTSINYVNPAFEKLTGFKSKEIIGIKAPYPWWIKNSQDFTCQKLNEAMKNGLEKTEISFNKKNGEKLWVELTFILIKKDGETKYYLSSWVDITDRKKAEGALRESEEKYRTLVETLPTRIWLKDKNSTFLSCNKALAKDLGIIPSDIFGKTDYDFFPKKMASKYIEDDKKVLKSGKTADIEETQIQNGKEIFIHTIKTPFRDENGNIYGTMGIFWDESDRKKVEEDLLNSEKRFKTFFEYAPDAYYISDLKGIFIDGNKAAEQLVGYKREDLIGKNFLKLIPPTRLIKVSSLFAKNVLRKNTGPVEGILIRKDGVKITVEVRIYPIKFKNKSMVLGIARDITDKKKAEKALKESEEKYRSIFENPIIGAYKSTLGGKYIDVNSTLVKMLGYPSKKDLLLVDIKKDLYCSEKDRPSYNKRKKPFKVHLKKKDGSRIWVEVSSKVIYNNGRPIGYEGIVIDITERKKAEGKLRYLSFHDSLTGIYNRTFFSEELERLQKSRDFPISIISLDVDGLKIINDYLGHCTGDKLLTTLTILFQKAIRKSDIFARVGGDEFVILLPKTDYDKGREIIDRISEEIENHNDKNESFPLILSTGLATSFNKEDKLIETNIRADNAMYNEKNSKKQKSREIIGNYLNKLNK